MNTFLLTPFLILLAHIGTASEQQSAWLSPTGKEVVVENRNGADLPLIEIPLPAPGRFLLRAENTVYVAHKNSFTVLNPQTRQWWSEMVPELRGSWTGIISGPQMVLHDRYGAKIIYDISRAAFLLREEAVTATGIQRPTRFPVGSAAAMVTGVLLPIGGVGMAVGGALAGPEFTPPGAARDYSLNRSLFIMGALVSGLGIGLLAGGIEGVRIHQQRHSAIPHQTVEDHVAGAKRCMLVGGIISALSVAMAVAGPVLLLPNQDRTPVTGMASPPKQDTPAIGLPLTIFGDLLLPVGTALFGVGLARYVGFNDLTQARQASRASLVQSISQISLAPAITRQSVGLSLSGLF